jgi:hypothetical protein
MAQYNCDIELSIAYSGGAYCVTHRCNPVNCSKVTALDSELDFHDCPEGCVEPGNGSCAGCHGKGFIEIPANES